jgi:sodium/potassium-transporting ATPase subunit alpha
LGVQKEEIIMVDKVDLAKDELKKVQTKGEGYRNMDEHRIDLNQLALRLHTSLVDGMKENDAVEVNLKDGDNRLSERKKLPMWVRFIMELFQPFSSLLWICSVLCFALYGSDTSAQGASSNLILGSFIYVYHLRLCPYWNHSPHWWHYLPVDSQIRSSHGRL